MPEIDDLISPDALFKWLIYPCAVTKFFSEYYEKQPLLVKRGNPGYYNGICSVSDIKDLVASGKLKYGEDADVAKLDKTGRRITPSNSKKGQIIERTFWKEYFKRQQCSLRLLAPDEHSEKLRRILYLLDEFFGVKSGSNAYLTPCSSQGFAPHFDDVDVFMAQTEGSKQWRIYDPPEKHQILSRVSSGNFHTSEFNNPKLDVILCAGDLLYLPRGTVHQGIASNTGPSLHITFSVNQLTSWGDFLTRLSTLAIRNLTSSQLAWRKSIPRDLVNCFGLLHDRTPDSQAIRNGIISTIRRLLSASIDPAHLPIDKAVDDFAAEKFFPGRILPKRTRWSCQDALTQKCKVRLISRHAIRVTKTRENLTVFYPTKSMLEEGNGVGEVDISVEFLPTLETLVEAFPKYTEVSDFKMAYEEVDPEADLEEILGLLKAFKEFGVIECT